MIHKDTTFSIPCTSERMHTEHVIANSQTFQNVILIHCEVLTFFDLLTQHFSSTGLVPIHVVSFMMAV